MFVHFYLMCHFVLKKILKISFISEILLHFKNVNGNLKLIGHILHLPIVCEFSFSFHICPQTMMESIKLIAMIDVLCQVQLYHQLIDVIVHRRTVHPRNVVLEMNWCVRVYGWLADWLLITYKHTNKYCIYSSECKVAEWETTTAAATKVKHYQKWKYDSIIWFVNELVMVYLHTYWL